MALVNGIEYSYVSLSFAFLGNMDVKGVQAITYKVKKASENLYGAGEEPVGIGYDSKKYEGEIKLMRKDIMAIKSAAGNKSLVDIAPFDAVVAFANGTDPTKTDTLRYMRFMEDGLEAATGDIELPLTIPIMYSGIESK